MLSLRYSVQHVTNSRDNYTELFDRLLKTATRVPGHWSIEGMVAYVQRCRKGKL